MFAAKNGIIDEYSPCHSLHIRTRPQFAGMLWRRYCIDISIVWAVKI